MLQPEPESGTPSDKSTDALDLCSHDDRNYSGNRNILAFVVYRQNFEYCESDHHVIHLIPDCDIMLHDQSDLYPSFSR
jgi:hypothetical protein